MKKQLLVCAILICNLGFSQQMYLKSSTYALEGVTDLLQIQTHYYNDNFLLDSILLHDQYNNVYGIYKFEDERKVEYTHGSTYKFWNYFDGYLVENTIEYPGNLFQHTYFLNQNYQVYTDTLGHLNITYNWSNGNLSSIMTENTIAHDTTWDYMNYDESILNPWYESNKYFKQNYRGSVNYITIHNSAVFTVLDTINNYPKFVIQEVGNQNAGTWAFEYYIIDEIPENNIELVVISTAYYNELGQKIEKPEQGFYIERKLTNMGIISNKYFIK